MSDTRTRGQRWADKVTVFSGSWTFITVFVTLSVVWVGFNMVEGFKFDPYPFMFLNWVLTVVSTFQNPLIMLSQNRQNETDEAKTQEVLRRLEEIERLLQVSIGTPRDEQRH